MGDRPNGLFLRLNYRVRVLPTIYYPSLEQLESYDSPKKSPILTKGTTYLTLPSFSITIKVSNFNLKCHDQALPSNLFQSLQPHPLFNGPAVPNATSKGTIPLKKVVVASHPLDKVEFTISRPLSFIVGRQSRSRHRAAPTLRVYIYICIVVGMKGTFGMDERPRAEIYGSISIFRAAGAGRG